MIQYGDNIKSTGLINGGHIMLKGLLRTAVRISVATAAGAAGGLVGGTAGAKLATKVASEGTKLAVQYGCQTAGTIAGASVATRAMNKIELSHYMRKLNKAQQEEENKVD